MDGRLYETWLEEHWVVACVARGLQVGCKVWILVDWAEDSSWRRWWYVVVTVVILSDGSW